ncbi:MAG: AMIN domain-containing protein [Desulfobulbaceae bacterium]|nr:AMIN domain-containing protein [Desulfobulbaceae bacterium]
MTLVSRLKIVSLIAIFVLACSVLSSQGAENEIKLASYRIDAINWSQIDGSWLCEIKGDSKPAYTMYELFSPHRIIIDIAYGVLSEKAVGLPLEFDNGPVTLIKGKAVTSQDPHVARIELYLVSDNIYSVTNNGNDILVKFESNGDQAGSNGQKKEPKNMISDVKINNTGEKTEIYLLASSAIQAYQSTEIPKEKNHPAKLLVDVADVPAVEHAVPVGDNSPVALVRTENYKGGTRIVLDSASDALFRYSISGQEDGLLITIEPSFADASQVVAGITGLPEAAISKQESSVPKSMVIPAAVTPSTPSPKMVSPVDELDEPEISDFSFAGYNEQKISVDFFKIDLHNVFRLIGEISGRNIVVAEGVNGSLTLALNDVPWDFVLDIILNLKDLAKEERYGTIVISQKSQSFSWPEKAEDNLAIKQGVEAISVTKRLDVPREKLEAQKVMRQAKSLIDSGNHSGALALYEKAFMRQPDSGELAKRIAKLALGSLGLNAKAAHYGQIASSLLPQDKEVALLTALSLANMEKVQDATGYFDLAVSGARPSRQALASYAAFSEQNGSFQMALSLLNKYEALYGTSLETMISKARNYDETDNKAKATEEYKAILLSGYAVPPDLEKYIKARVKE